MKYSIVLNETAQADLSAIFRYIAVDLQAVQNANAQLSRIEKAIAKKYLGNGSRYKEIVCLNGLASNAQPHKTSLRREIRRLWLCFDIFLITAFRFVW